MFIARMRSLCFTLFTIITLCLLFFNDCAGKDATSYKRYDESSLYIKAMEDLQSNNLKKFRNAKKRFQQVNDLYPFSYWGKRALVMAAFSAYLAGDYIDSAMFANHYIKVYKDGQDLAYMANLRANAYLKNIKDIESGLENAHDAKKYFNYIKENFQESKYAIDATQKLVIVNGLLASKILSIGLFYEKNALYHSAINRFMQIINDYHYTQYYHEAVFRIIECYKAINLIDDAKKYYEILKTNQLELAEKINI